MTGSAHPDYYDDPSRGEEAEARLELMLGTRTGSLQASP